MQFAAGFTCELKGDSHRAKFRFDRARVEVIPPTDLPLAAPLFSQRMRHLIIFGMHSNGKTTSSGNLHSTFEHDRVRVSEITCPTSTHESLEPNCTGFGHLRHGVEVIRCETAPKCEVQYRLGLC